LVVALSGSEVDTSGVGNEPLSDDVDLLRDRVLVERAQGGDAAAFDELYQRYYRRLYRFCLRRLHDTHEAEDVSQEAFTRAWRALETFGGDRRFYPWLSVIAAHLCTDVLRRRNRTTPVAEFHPSNLASTADEGEDAAIAAVDSQLVAEAFTHLSERHQRILHLREGSGWSYQRIADHEGLGITAVETLLWRARQALKREFAVLAGSDGRIAALLGTLLSAGLLARLARLHRRMAAKVADMLGTALSHTSVAATGIAAVATAAVVAATLGGSGTRGSDARVSSSRPASSAPAGRYSGNPASTSGSVAGSTRPSGATGAKSTPPADRSGSVITGTGHGGAGLVGSSVSSTIAGGALGGTVKGVTGALGGTVKGVTGTLGNTVQGTTGVLGNTVKGVTGALGGTVKGVTGTLGTATGSLPAPLDSLGKVAQPLGSAASGAVSGLGSTLGNTLSGLGSTLGSGGTTTTSGATSNSTSSTSTTSSAAGGGLLTQTGDAVQSLLGGL
jgi:RNA polymerase sigma-70 factor (ECF subfamily)